MLCPECPLRVPFSPPGTLWSKHLLQYPLLRWENSLRFLYPFPTSAVANNYNLAGMNNIHLLSYRSGGWKSVEGFAGLKLECRKDCVPSGAHRENPCPVFSSFWRHLRSLACGVFLNLQSQQRSLFRPFWLWILFPLSHLPLWPSHFLFRGPLRLL